MTSAAAVASCRDAQGLQQYPEIEGIDGADVVVDVEDRVDAAIGAALEEAVEKHRGSGHHEEQSEPCEARSEQQPAAQRFRHEGARYGGKLGRRRVRGAGRITSGLFGGRDLRHGP